MEKLTTGVVRGNGYRYVVDEEKSPRYAQEVAARICGLPEEQGRQVHACLNRMSYSVYQSESGSLHWRYRDDLHPTYPIEQSLDFCIEAGQLYQEAKNCVDLYAQGIKQGAGYRVKLGPDTYKYPVPEALRLCAASGAAGPVAQCVAREVGHGMSRRTAQWSCQSGASDEVRGCIRRFEVASFGMVSEEAILQACSSDPRVSPSDASRLAGCLGRSQGLLGEHVAPNALPRPGEAVLSQAPAPGSAAPVATGAH